MRAGCGEHVPDGAAAYAFADPPYGGEGIQYAELSALWCAWLEPAPEPAYDAEIGENPHRGRDRTAFAHGLLDGFRAVHRALAPDARMTVTFASSDRRSWQALDAALAGAGFRVPRCDRVRALGAGADGANVTARDAHRRVAGVRAGRGAIRVSWATVPTSVERRSRSCDGLLRLPNPRTAQPLRSTSTRAAISSSPWPSATACAARSRTSRGSASLTPLSAAAATMCSMAARWTSSVAWLPR